jgi:hypothetical protein
MIYSSRDNFKRTIEVGFVEAALLNLKVIVAHMDQMVFVVCANTNCCCY